MTPSRDDDAPFVVVVEFAAKPGRLPDLLALALENAARSLAEEPGCRRFDVVRLEEDGEGLLFYEIYDSRAAFDAHTRTAHFAAFREKIGDVVRERSAPRFARLQDPDRAGNLR